MELKELEKIDTKDFKLSKGTRQASFPYGTATLQRMEYWVDSPNYRWHEDWKMSLNCKATIIKFDDRNDFVVSQTRYNGYCVYCPDLETAFDWACRMINAAENKVSIEGEFNYNV